MTYRGIERFRNSGIQHFRGALDLHHSILYEDEMNVLSTDQFWTSGVAGWFVAVVFGGGGTARTKAVQAVLSAWFDYCQKGGKCDYLKLSDNLDGGWANNIGEAMLELFWYYFGLQRPPGVPWLAWHAGKVQRWKEKKKERNPNHVEFYKSFSGTDWIPHTSQRERQAKGEQPLVIDESFDMHSWKDSQDPWICAVCVRLLCRPVDGRIAERDNLEEACDALKKLFTSLPRRISPDPAFGVVGTQETLPHANIFPLRDWFLLAWHLGRKEDAKTALRMAAKLDKDIQRSDLQEFSLHEFVDIPEVYECLAEYEKDTGQILTPFLTDDDVKESSDLLLEALKERASKGKQEPLKAISWEELLRRFSEAIFVTKQEEYEGLDEPPQTPNDILLPPLTQAEIEHAENRLGPIPADIKEMSLVAKGFKGGWHFAGGGFPGLDNFWRDPWKESEVYIEELESFKEMIVSPYQPPNPAPNGRPWMALAFPENLDFGNFYKAGGGDFADSYYHVLIPPEAWKKIKKGNVKEEGEYKYFTYSNWGGNQDNAPSVRQWIEDMTATAELRVSFLNHEKAYAQRHGIDLGKLPEWQVANSAW